jgi:hypothetical protein
MSPVSAQRHVAPPETDDCQIAPSPGSLANADEGDQP